MIIQPQMIKSESEAIKMDGITQEKIYNQLFRAWKRAHSSKKLQKLIDQERFFPQIRLLGNELRRQLKEAENLTIQLIIQKSLANIQYMISDFLAIREEKIIKAAQHNEPIQEETLFSFEKRFYQQLHPAFRGISKAKQQILQPLRSPNNFISFPESNLDGEDLNNKTEIHSDSSLNIKNSEMTSIADIDSEELNSDSIEIEKISQEPLNSIFITDDSPISTSLDRKLSISMDNIQFQRILATKKIEPFVGIDFTVYGPIKKGEIAFIPITNAEIFHEENMVELLRS
ncbi:MAG: DNA replication complex subunit Gins51 [Promethearchaeota archaeon]